jgi:hypothetical protein
MAQNVTVLEVLVSSPSDLRDEREAIQEISQDLNTTWRTTLGVQLNLLMWEKDTRPSLGSDAQEVVNRQLGNRYDIFIGMMGARFGTETTRAQSGTEEEFEGALRRFQEDPQSVSVLFYFRDSPPTSLSEIDPDQLRKVQQFRRRVEGMGLVRIFKSRDELTRMLRIHLAQEVQEWLKRNRKENVQKVGTTSEDYVPQLETDPEISEEGYLDLLERGEEGLENVGRSMQRIAAAANEIAARTNERTTELNAINAQAASAGVPPDRRAIKRNANQVAAALNEFVTRLDAEIPIYTKAFKSGIDPFVQALSMIEIRHGTPEQLASARHSISQMVSSQDVAIASYRDLRDTFAHTPRMTTALNAARRRAVDCLSRLIEEFEKGLRLAREFDDFLSRLDIK